MSGGTDKLVRMANQIAQFFGHQQGANAAAATAEHLRLFWDPDMRAQIIANLGEGGAVLHPIAREAVVRLRSGSEVQL